MHAVSWRLRAMKTGSPLRRNSSSALRRRDRAFAGASVTRTVCTLVAAVLPAEALSCANRILRDEHGSARMFEQLPLLVRRKFVIERNENAAGKKRVSRNQPLRLIRHDDAGAREPAEKPPSCKALAKDVRVP